MTNKYYELNEETGEITETNKVLVELHPGDQIRRKNQIDYYSNNNNNKINNGSFVWLLFKYGEDLFPNISPANLTRLMYAATFVKSNGKIMKKNKLKEKMNLNRARWNDFWNEMIDNNIFYEQDNYVYLNSDYVCKGEINTDQNYTRLFCEYVRQLYEACGSSADHKQLSYIFKIIPFINRRTNIVCRNPSEQDESLIRTMRLGDFCDVIGYERKNSKRLARDLLKIRINGELAIGFFVTDMDEQNWIIVSNPKLYFGGKYDIIFNKYRQLFINEAKEHKMLEEENNAENK